LTQVVRSLSGVVRSAGEADAEAVAAVWLGSRKASVPSIPEPVHSDEDVRSWVADVLVPAGQTWVLDGRPGVVAMMTLVDGWIEQLYVDPEWCGLGAGSTLVQHAKSLSSGGLDLWTFQSNTRARHFYERHGFVPVGETSGENEESAPDTHYRWDG
jgi:GNAT superfamily N-acetyltransferase